MKFRRILRVGLKGLGALLLLVAAVLAFGAWQYHREMAINTPNGINEAGYVRIGGIDQWVQIRGDDKSNPVMLWLNGGPGGSTVQASYFYRDWEKHFTLVMWDQRGEGKTFAKSGVSVAPTMTIDRMAQDGIELADHLRGRLHHDKIIIMGHSWGSILGVHMALKRPDLFYAYVGTGQVHQMRDDFVASYPRLLARARAMHNEKAVKDLETAGPPPYPGAAKYLVPLQWANELDGPLRLSVPPASIPAGLWATLVNVAGLISLSPGAQFSVDHLLDAILAENLSAAAPRLDVPVIVIAGSEDLVTPAGKTWLDGLAAPRKEFLPISGGGHLAILGRQADFLDLLVRHVRPLAH
jgi:pimeloyl-ACP methyl ester carboxylesterase